VKDLRRLQEKGGYPPVVLVFRDSVERGDQFFAKNWPTARAVADVTGEWWTAFSVKPVGSLWTLFGPGMFVAAARSLFRGNFIGMPGAAPLTEPGAFLLDRDGGILRQHVFEHIGDHPDFEAFGKVR
jgi:hypothetical protein